MARSRKLLESTGPASLTEEYRTLGASNGPGASAHRHTAWVRERALLVCDASGARLAITHIATDVTWQMDTTARLRADTNARPGEVCPFMVDMGKVCLFDPKSELRIT